MTEFIPFPKIPRLAREITVTEKIDGTNAQVHIRQDSESPFDRGIDIQVTIDGYGYYLRAGSRTRWINTQDDNHGFARWVYDHAHELAALGPGKHFGEWWGAGIQRRYGLTEKRFSLFNAARWGESRPACCHVVPVLYRGPFSEEAIDACLFRLKDTGSVAAPGFPSPEGVIVWHDAAQQYFKRTLDKDEEWKGKAA